MIWFTDCDGDNDHNSTKATHGAFGLPWRSNGTGTRTMYLWLSNPFQFKAARLRKSARSNRAKATRNELNDAPAMYENGADGPHLNRAGLSAKMAKANRARDRGYVQVFLSHKGRDQKAAEQLREVLQAYGGPRLGYLCIKHRKRRRLPR